VRRASPRVFCDIVLNARTRKERDCEHVDDDDDSGSSEGSVAPQAHVRNSYRVSRTCRPLWVRFRHRSTDNVLQRLERDYQEVVGSTCRRDVSRAPPLTIVLRLAERSFDVEGAASDECCQTKSFPVFPS
jgi:hypothetical protein